MARVLKIAENNEPAAKYDILDPSKGFDMLPKSMADRVQDPCRDKARKDLGYSQHPKPTYDHPSYKK